MAVCCFYLVSCEKRSDASFSVSVVSAVVGPEAGDQWVSVRCAGDWTLSLADDEGEVDWAELNVVSGTGDKTNVRLSYESNTSEVYRTLNIYLDNGKSVTQCSFKQLSFGEEPETPSDAGVDLTKTGWLELPAMDDPNLEYYSHSFEMNGKRYRNYSFGYSKKDYLAVWVAYPINPMYTTGNFKDSGKWGPNPLLDSSYQPNFSNSFGNNRGYQRGHQIANADRKCSSEANAQTFYYTNATLQHEDFNGPIWGGLEDDIRLTVKKQTDTCYVVTGCVVPDNPETITDRSGHKVPIPSAYFKAALRYAEGDSFGTWLSAAFYYDHKTYAKEVMTVDALEERLGMNFFINFEKKYGNAASKVEAQDPNQYKSVWGID